MNEEEIIRVVTEVVKEELAGKGRESKPVLKAAISARHMHLTKEHFEILFGKGIELTVFKPLSQPGQFAANEKVDIIGPKNSIAGVRILGPFRKESQIEVSMTDCFHLGVKPVVRQSGDIKGTPGIKVKGPKGEIELKEGVIVAARHIHAHTSEANLLGLKDKDIVRVRKGGERGIIFENVLVRVSDQFSLELHLDTDEGNAGMISQGDVVELV